MPFSLIPLALLSLLVVLFSNSLAALSTTVSYELAFIVQLLASLSIRAIVKSDTIRFPYGTGKRENFSGLLFGALSIPTSLLFFSISPSSGFFAPAPSVSLGIANCICYHQSFNRQLQPMIPTPYYLIDKSALLRNLQTISHIRNHSGAKVLLALKCFAAWSVFDFMRKHMDGSTSSSLFEAKLGKQKFGGETHAYSVAFSDHEIEDVVANCDKIIFNSISQFQRFKSSANNRQKGLRLNPGISCAGFDLADPARPFSRLGESDLARITAIADDLDGVMIHNNCENKDFARFDGMLTQIEERYGELFHRLRWVSLGGGISFTAPDYPLNDFCERLRQFARTYDIQVYLEPGEAVVRHTTTLEVSIVDTGFNGRNLAVVDSSTEAHMLDLIIYGETAPIGERSGDHIYQICGKTCLAGDIFGDARFPAPLQIGDRLSIFDAGAYTMVKKNWFNGIHMPAIAVREIDGSVHVVREFGFDDYVGSLS